MFRMIDWSLNLSSLLPLTVGDVKLNLKGMMKQKEDAVKGLTTGIAYLFKNNKVC